MTHTLLNQILVGTSVVLGVAVSVWGVVATLVSDANERKDAMGKELQ